MGHSAAHSHSHWHASGLSHHGHAWRRGAWWPSNHGHSWWWGSRRRPHHSGSAVRHSSRVRCRRRNNGRLRRGFSHGCRAARLCHPGWLDHISAPTCHAVLSERNFANFSPVGRPLSAVSTLPAPPWRLSARSGLAKVRRQEEEESRGQQGEHSQQPQLLSSRQLSSEIREIVVFKKKYCGHSQQPASSSTTQ